MKISIFFLSICLFILACKKDNQPKQAESQTYYGLDFDAETFNWDTLKGIYVGDFNKSDLRLDLIFASSAHVVGSCSYKGIVRNVSGTVEYYRDSVILEISEPGDLPSDGKFSISLNPITLEMEGIWKINNESGIERTFLLKKRNQKNDFDFDTPLDKQNLSSFMHTMVDDSSSVIYFQDDGNVLFEYYPNVDSTQVAQMIKIKGGWTYRDKKLTIDWQPNEVFVEQKSIIKVKRDEDYISIILFNRTFHNQYY